MANNSINTNISAQVALANLNRTNRDLDGVQNKISTGLKVGRPQDDAAVFSVAQGIRGTIQALGAVQTGLSGAVGVGQVSLNGLTQISELAKDVREKVTLLASDSLTTSQRTTYQNDLAALVTQLNATVNNSVFNGANLLNGAPITISSFISNVNGGVLVICSVSAASAIATLSGCTAAATTAALAQALLTGTALASFEAYIATALGNLAAQVRGIELQNDLIDSLSDSLEEGLGALVDADLAEESAALQALQTKQQLGVQALSIANSRPQILLNLFQG